MDAHRHLGDKGRKAETTLWNCFEKKKGWKRSFTRKENRTKPKAIKARSQKLWSQGWADKWEMQLFRSICESVFGVLLLQSGILPITVTEIPWWICKVTCFFLPSCWTMSYFMFKPQAALCCNNHSVSSTKNQSALYALWPVLCVPWSNATCIKLLKTKKKGNNKIPTFSYIT